MHGNEYRETTKVLAICGSLKKTSTTRKALRLALDGAEAAGASVGFADLTSYDLALCTGDKSPDAKGKDFACLRQEIRFAHGLIVATPEYHGSFSGLLKNALDLHDIDDLQGKVVAIVATAGGKQGGSGALAGLRGVFKALKAWVLPQDVSISEAHKAFAEDGSAVDGALQLRLNELGRHLARFAALHSETALIRPAPAPNAPVAGAPAVSAPIPG